VKIHCFTCSVEIEAENEQRARELFDAFREATLPSNWGILLWALTKNRQQQDDLSPGSRTVNDDGWGE
jgi:hypothetical protein